MLVARRQTAARFGATRREAVMVLRAKARYRADDLWDTPDDGNIYEVIDGVLHVMPPPRFSHQNAIAVLLRFLLPYIFERKLGTMVPAPVGVVLDEENGVQPDIVFVARERLDIISERGIEGAPDLVVEVLSPSTQARDRGIKMRRYAAAGVRYYWIVLRRPRAIEEYRLGPEGYELVGRFDTTTTFRPELFPGLEIPVAALWE
jgi:Uma2 family endonuclease